MTPVQAAVLEAVKAADEAGTTAREVARAVWPDDPGWNRRTAGRGASSFNGAHGGTMPLRAGRVLRRLEDAGLVEYDYERRRWTAR